MPPFRFSGAFSPTGDQPGAIEELVDGAVGRRALPDAARRDRRRARPRRWPGVEQLQRPALVIAHNKTLAAQLCNEFREFFPRQRRRVLRLLLRLLPARGVPPASDTYIEKDSAINDDIDRLRHAATSAPADAPRRHHRRVRLLHLRPRLAGGVRGAAGRARVGGESGREYLLRELVGIQYAATTSCWAAAVPRARRRDRGPAGVHGDGVPRLAVRRRGRVASRTSTRSRARSSRALDELIVYPATHYVTSPPTLERAIEEIGGGAGGARRAVRGGRASCSRRTASRQRTEYDLEMMREIGYCNGIENYSRILDGRAAGPAAVHAARLLPARLPRLHRRVAQHRAADRRHVRGRPLRKSALVEHGFRLPSALDNRPLRFDEFVQRVDADGVRLGHAGRLRAAATRRGWSSRSSAPRAWSTPRSRCGRRRGQIDDLLGRDPRPRARPASACW